MNTFSALQCNPKLTETIVDVPRNVKLLICDLELLLEMPDQLWRKETPFLIQPRAFRSLWDANKESAFVCFLTTEVGNCGLRSRGILSAALKGNDRRVRL